MKFVWELFLSILVAPINAIAWIITELKIRNYNPEKRPCPSCGYKGEKSSGGIACLVLTVSVSAPKSKALRHSCLRCSAEYYSPTLTDPAKWASQDSPLDKVAKAKAAAATTRL